MFVKQLDGPGPGRTNGAVHMTSYCKYLRTSVQLSSLLFAKTQTNLQTNKQIKTFVHSHTLIGKYPGTYTDDLTAEEILGHQSDVDLRSSSKYTIDFIFVVLSLGASMLAEL